MGDRVSETILLCEDEAHERFTKAYLKVCGLAYQPPQLKSRVASREQQGGNDSWVLNRFPTELHACRQRQKAKAETLLIVMLDADKFSVQDRRHQLFERLKSAGFDEYGAKEPAVLLIPKRHVETWIRVLLGEKVTEDEVCKPWKKLEKQVLRQAAETLYSWSRPNATPGATCVDSLRASLPEWRRIG